MVARGTVALPHPKHPERFSNRKYVLCGDGLTGRCYWEAEWTASVFVGLTYKRIRRNGWDGLSKFGDNHLSWSIHCAENQQAWEIPFISVHNKRKTYVVFPFLCSCRVGVYLDWLALSPSTVSPLTHWPTFHATFTEPLYPGFGVLGTVRLCQLSIRNAWVQF
jgi:hypothetical protein